MAINAPTNPTVLDAIASRRSIRDFSAEPVSAEHIRRLLDAAVMAPTAMHEEPWRFVIVQDKAALRRYSDAAKAWLVEQSRFRDLHNPNAMPKNGGFMRELSRPDFNIFYNAGTLILICGDLKNPFVTADCWLAAGNLLLAATGLGLGACCIGSALPALNLPEIAAELQIPPGHTAVAAIIVGHPAGMTKAGAAAQRKPPVIINWRRSQA